MNWKHVSAVVLLAITAGCLGMITGDTVEQTSEPVYVSNDTLDETGYEHETTKNITIEESISVGEGDTREVHLENYQSTYVKTDGMVGEEAMLVAYTSPVVDVAGYSLNPLNQMDNERMLELVVSQQDRSASLESVGETTVTALGEERTVTEFNGTTTVDGREAHLSVHMAEFKHEGDHVIVAGIYPEEIDESEEILTLIENLERRNGE